MLFCLDDINFVSSVLTISPSLSLSLSLSSLSPLSLLAVISSCDECDQLCIVTANTLRCDCHPGYRLSQNRHSCYIDESKHVTVSCKIMV